MTTQRANEVLSPPAHLSPLTALDGRAALKQRSLKRIAQVAVVPSTATSGEGEAFVLAVRLALDRVRALSAAGQLSTGKAAEDDPEHLFGARAAWSRSNGANERRIGSLGHGLTGSGARFGLPSRKDGVRRRRLSALGRSL